MSARAVIRLAALAAVAALAVSAPQAQTAKPAAKPAAKPGAQATAKPSPGAGPVVVIETEKGTIEFETYPNEAPKTVEHVLELVKRRFYNGQRFVRAEGSFLIQMGDPASRDMTKRDDWGQGGSGKSIGVSEVSKLHLNVRGAVAMAHRGDPRGADSQFYILRSAHPELNAKYTVFGKVISGMDVVDKIALADRIVRVTVRN